MPRQRKSTTKKKVCKICKREKAYSNFYITNKKSTMSEDGKTVDVCKNCIKNGSYDKSGDFSTEKFKEQLMLIDRPYIPEVLEAAKRQTQHSLAIGRGATDIVGLYFKNILTLPQYTNLSFLESLKLLEINGNSDYTVEKVEKKKIAKEDVFIKPSNDFVVTDELVERFGSGYTKTEYKEMEKKYNNLKKDIVTQSVLQEESLLTYVRFKVKEEAATAQGDISFAEKWNKAAQDAAINAKITPKQLTKADLQGGVNTVGEICKGVEQAVDVIEVLPHFKYRPNDVADFIIWCYVNYLRRLKGYPEIEYKDVYEFYDKEKENYIKQYGDPYGIFEGDPSAKNRNSIEQFISIPPDYMEDNGGDSND